MSRRSSNRLQGGSQSPTKFATAATDTRRTDSYYPARSLNHHAEGSVANAGFRSRTSTTIRTSELYRAHWATTSYARSTCRLSAACCLSPPGRSMQCRQARASDVRARVNSGITSWRRHSPDGYRAHRVFISLVRSANGLGLVPARALCPAPLQASFAWVPTIHAKHGSAMTSG